MSGWQIRPVADVCTMVTDGSHFSPATTAAGYPYITVRDIKEGQIDFENCAFVNEVSFDELRRNGCAPLVGDVLFSKDGTVGKVALVATPREFVVLSSLAILRPNCSLIDPAFLSYVLMSPAFLEAAIGQKTGVAIRRIILKNLKQIPVPYPSLAEQRRIVAILDQAFKGIAAAKANAEKSLQNARELFEWHHLTAFSRAREVSSEQRLGDIASFRNGINYTKQSKGRLVRIIGVRNFQDHFWAPTDDLDSVTLDGELGAADAVEEGDILSVRSNGNPELIGRCMLVGKFSGRVTHSGFTIRIRLHSRGAMPQYICQYLKSREVRRKLVDGGTGLNIKSLNQGMLSDLVIPLPPVEGQQALVDEIEAMKGATAELADIAIRKLAALAELKKSLLQQAFTGALTDNSTDEQVAKVA